MGAEPNKPTVEPLASMYRVVILRRCLLGLIDDPPGPISLTLSKQNNGDKHATLCPPRTFYQS